MEQFKKYFVGTIKNKYINFDGRATRSEYWYFALFSFMIVIVLKLIDAYAINPLLGATPEEAVQGGILQVIFVLSLLLPAIGVTVRRLHDIGKSAWWLLLVLIPLIGALVLLYFYVIDSQKGSNEFGENPKGE
ncbi:MAG: DUF805 domain-containing protein [Sulfurovum sp.]|nr:DUF805 domain-containing protein [Sulfurovum sp.]